MPPGVLRHAGAGVVIPRASHSLWKRMAAVIELQRALLQGVRLSGRRWVAPATDPASTARCTVSPTTATCAWYTRRRGEDLNLRPSGYEPNRHRATACIRVRHSAPEQGVRGVDRVTASIRVQSRVLGSGRSSGRSHIGHPTPVPPPELKQADYAKPGEVQTATTVWVRLCASIPNVIMTLLPFAGERCKDRSAGTTQWGRSHAPDLLK